MYRDWTASEFMIHPLKSHYESLYAFLDDLFILLFVSDFIDIQVIGIIVSYKLYKFAITNIYKYVALCRNNGRVIIKNFVINLLVQFVLTQCKYFSPQSLEVNLKDYTTLGFYRYFSQNDTNIFTYI